MSKYLVVTPKKIVHFDNYREAFNYYEVQPIPCGVYEVELLKVQSLGMEIGLTVNVVHAVNVKAEFHLAKDNSPECFLHLHNMLNNNNYKEGSRCKQ